MTNKYEVVQQDIVNNQLTEKVKITNRSLKDCIDYVAISNIHNSNNSYIYSQTFYVRKVS